MTYRIIEKNNKLYRTFIRDEVYFEVPAHKDPNEAYEDYYVKKQIALATSLHENMQDDIYVNKQIKRSDYSISKEEAQPLLNILQSNWPSINFTKNSLNLVGSYEGYRPPYTGSSISWYNFEKPSVELLADYGLLANSYDYKPWYGLKFDLTTKEVLLKAVVEDQSIGQDERPVLPPSAKFFARIYYKDGTVDPMIDCYVYASPATMRDYCDSVGITYPLPDDNQEFNCWIWGIVYNSQTLEVTHVKSYIRHS